MIQRKRFHIQSKIKFALNKKDFRCITFCIKDNKKLLGYMIFVLNALPVHKSGLPFFRILLSASKLKMNAGAEKLLRRFLD